MRQQRITRVRVGAGLLAAGLLATPLFSLAADPVVAPGSIPTQGYTLSVEPIVATGEINRRWQPVVDALAKATGLKLQLHYYDGSERFAAAIAAGEPDLILAGPRRIWEARAHYRPVLRGLEPLSDVIVVLKTSPLQTLADLRGQTLAVPQGQDLRDPVLRALRDQHVAAEVVDMHTHSNCFLAVYLGKTAAASSNTVALALVAPEVRAKLRVIYLSAPLPPPALAVRRDFPAPALQQVEAALDALRDSNPTLMSNALMSRYTAADLERDYGMMAAPEAMETSAHGL